MVLSPALSQLIDKTPELLLRHNLHQRIDDPKFAQTTPIIFVPAKDYERVATANTRPNIRIEKYDPALGPAYYAKPERAPSLLYLPYPYLVPGGRFNEMYGWDTAFPVFAWGTTHPRMMREQIDNQSYQIIHYGLILNSNRAYQLGRSHPPLLSMMVMALLEASKDRPWSDFDPDGAYQDRTTWLTESYTALKLYHGYWMSGDRIDPSTGLSRYWDDLDTPSPELDFGEVGHFSHAIEHFKQALHVESDIAEATLFYDPDKGELTPFYYRADRTMRASGFDPTGHWGYGALRCIFHVPACLNSLLYRMELDMAEIAAILDYQAEVGLWQEEARRRKDSMFRNMWSEDLGCFLDLNLQSGLKNDKPFATLFHPLWTGLLDMNEDADKIDRIIRHALAMLEQPHGLSTSAEISGSQWDHPYGWPPLQYIACAGLMRYGRVEDARRLALKFCTTVNTVHTAEGAMYEKYNVVKGNADVHVVNGYDINVSENGTFLWTAAVTRLLAGLCA